MNKDADVIIIGAGLSGLSAAARLKKDQYKVVILEKNERPGGKLLTDEIDGFRMDRGFQVFLTSYPDAQRILHFNALQLKYFTPGAVLLHKGKKIPMYDPFRDPSKLLKMLFFPLAGLLDKTRLMRLRRRLVKMSYTDIFEQYEARTKTHLHKRGFSAQFVQSFFKPFFSGIFLENALRTSRRMFDFVFKMMNEGNIAVPKGGIEAIPKQLAERFSADELRLSSEVKAIKKGEVELMNGEILKADNVIVATDAAAPLLKDSKMPEQYSYTGGTTVYFKMEKAPVDHGFIMLNTAHEKLVNHLVVMSNVDASLAPDGMHLLAVCINQLPEISDVQLAADIKKEMQMYFETSDWQLLKVYRIANALPVQSSVLGDVSASRYTLQDGVYLCGDYLLYGSQNAAFRMGRKVAEKIISDDHLAARKNKLKNQ